MDLLTPKQEKFCNVYIETSNASEAYRQAYNSKNMKPETINRKAKELMDNGKIRARLEVLMEKFGVTAEKTLKRLMQGQEFDIRGLYHKTGVLKQPWELDDDTSRGVIGVKYDTDGNLIEYKIIDVKGCTELIGKHLKLFTDKTEHSVDPENPLSIILGNIDGNSRGL